MSQHTVKSRLNNIARVLHILRRAVVGVARETLSSEEYQQVVANFEVWRGTNRDLEKKTCQQCHQEFVGRGRKFCSPRCSALSSRKPQDLTPHPCRNCKQLFQSQKPYKFCPTCRNSRLKPKEPKFCAVCTESFIPIQPAQKFCTPNCKAKWFDKRSSRNRLKVLQEVGKCESCGELDRFTLHTHHINGKASPELMVLCANCHQKYHRTMGQSVFAETRTREDVLSVLKASKAAQATLKKAETTI